MRAVSSREFSEWKVLFKEEDEEKLTTREKWEYYAASIAYHIVLMNATERSKVKYNDFFYDYKTNTSPSIELSGEEKDSKKKLSSMVSKMKWGALLGLPLLKIDREKCQQKIS